MKTHPATTEEPKSLSKDMTTTNVQPSQSISNSTSSPAAPLPTTSTTQTHPTTTEEPKSLSETDKRKKLSSKRDREREGLCGECGIRTHEFRLLDQPKTTVKVPLTVANEVYRGRCLICHPRPRPRRKRRRRQLGTAEECSSKDVGSHNTSRGTSVHFDVDDLCGGGDGSSVGTFSIHHFGTIDSRGGGGTTSVRFDDDPSCGGGKGGGGSVGTFSIHLGTENESSVRQPSADVQEAALRSLDADTTDLIDIISCMRQYQNDLQVQERGCFRLWIQSWDDDDSGAIGRAGGITTILAAMRRWEGHRDLQHYGCEALQNMSLNRYNRDVVVRNGGIGIIINAMTAHRDILAVQRCGCTALANLVDSSGNGSIAERGDCIRSMVKAAENFPHDENVMREACHALRAMGYTNKLSQSPMGGIQNVCDGCYVGAQKH